MVTALAAVTAARTTRGQSDDVEPVRLVYEATAECPGAEAFAQGVFGRTTRARPAASDEAAREFEARVRAVGKRFVGHFILRDAGHESRRGPFAGKTCDEVADAIAFSVAITIDPNATAKPTVTPVSSAVPPAPSASASTTPAAPSAEPPAPTPVPSARAPQNVAPSHTSDERTLRASGGLHAITRAGIAGLPAIGPAAFVQLGTQTSPWFSPAVRLWAIAALEPDVAAAPVGQARFRWLLGRIDPCPLRFAAQDVSVVVCGIFEGGVVFAEGVGVDDAQTTRVAWLAGGGGARLAWRVAPSVDLELELDGLAPLRRDSFQFGPRAGPFTDSMNVPRFLPQASLGAAYRAP